MQLDRDSTLITYVVPEEMVRQYEAREAVEKMKELPADPPTNSVTAQELRFAEVFTNGTSQNGSNPRERIVPKPQLPHERVVGRSRADKANRDNSVARKMADTRRQLVNELIGTFQDIVTSITSADSFVTPRGTTMHIVKPFKEATDLGPRTKIPEAKPGRPDHSRQAPRR